MTLIHIPPLVASAVPASGGTMHYVHHPGDPWTATLRVARGTTLGIRLEPAAGYRWTTITCDEPELAQVTETGVDAAGTATATVTIGGGGTATLTAATSYVPDPYGPPTRLWRLAIIIEP